MPYGLQRPPVGSSVESFNFMEWFAQIANWIKGENSTRTVTTAYSASYNDKLININGNITVTLPDPTTCNGKAITCKAVNAGGGTRTVSGTIDGGSSWTTTTQYASATFQSDGIQWWTI